MFQIDTHDLDLAVQTVQKVYCPHRIALSKHAHCIDTGLAVSGPANWPLVRLGFGEPVDVDAGDFPDLFLVVKCVGGEGRLRQGQREAPWRQGATIPVSVNLATGFGFGVNFSQTSMKLDKQRLEALCSRWLGRPLELA
jgi:hypothetical protein